MNAQASASPGGAERDLFRQALCRLELAEPYMDVERDDSEEEGAKVQLLELCRRIAKDHPRADDEEG